MTHRGPFQPLPFCDSVVLTPSNFTWLCHSSNSASLTEVSTDLTTLSYLLLFPSASAEHHQLSLSLQYPL